jgi:hypothetical protein
MKFINNERHFQERHGLLEDCKHTFNQLCLLLKPHGFRFETIGFSTYLIPSNVETKNIATHNSHPNGVIRIAANWNWHASPKKTNWDNIQCPNKELPAPFETTYGENAFTTPIKGSCIAICVDGEYQTLYGEVYDRTIKQWGYRSPCILDIVKTILNK